MYTPSLRDSADWISTRSHTVAQELQQLNEHPSRQDIIALWQREGLGVKGGILWNQAMNLTLQHLGYAADLWPHLRSHGHDGSQQAAPVRSEWFDAFVTTHHGLLLRYLGRSTATRDVRAIENWTRTAKVFATLALPGISSTSFQMLISVGGGWAGEAAAAHQAFGLSDDCLSHVIDPALPNTTHQFDDVLLNAYPEDGKHLKALVDEGFKSQVHRVVRHRATADVLPQLATGNDRVLVVSSAFLCSVNNPADQLNLIHQLPVGSVWVFLEAEPVLEWVSPDFVVHDVAPGKSLGVKFSEQTR